MTPYAGMSPRWDRRQRQRRGFLAYADEQQRGGRRVPLPRLRPVADARRYVARRVLSFVAGGIFPQQSLRCHIANILAYIALPGRRRRRVAMGLAKWLRRHVSRLLASSAVFSGFATVLASVAVVLACIAITTRQLRLHYAGEQATGRRHTPPRRRPTRQRRPWAALHRPRYSPTSPQSTRLQAQPSPLPVQRTVQQSSGIPGNQPRYSYVYATIPLDVS